MILYHGSDKVIKKPIYGFGKTTNDYGRGFYMTKDIELAKEWSASDGIEKSYVNVYEINENKLNILDLDEVDDKVLKWIALLVKYREFNLKNEISILGKKYLIDKYLINVDKYDMIRGYRADDCYFMFAKSFLYNQISIEKLGKALKLGKLGDQYVLKSRKAFEMIKFKESIVVDANEYYYKRLIRNKQAVKQYDNIINKIDNKSKYLSDIINEK